ncbi:MAG: RNase adapter RapZ, partial [Actinomycetota bacterium]|nr:RNase adapter RapZ [Actinomycetota bacterium]
MTDPPPSLDLVIVTGLSGAGRSTVALALEDVGYYVVDNLPQSLVESMVALGQRSEGTARRMALTLDVRSRAFSSDLMGTVQHLRDQGYRPRVIYLDASDESLIRRYDSARRRHPLQGDGRLSDGIAAERALLDGARGDADMVIDTSDLNVNQLRSRIEALFRGTDAPRLAVTLLSFGYKYGLPGDADLVIDVRFLPNPHWVPELRDQTGRDPEVSAHVLGQPAAGEFLDSYVALLLNLIPGYEREGKRYLTAAVGCTGGKHRSVVISEEIGRRLAACDVPV